MNTFIGNENYIWNLYKINEISLVLVDIDFTSYDHIGILLIIILRTNCKEYLCNKKKSHSK